MLDHWIYSQSTGVLTTPNGTRLNCYSGHGNGRNNPAMQNVPNIGPLPCGWYKIVGPFNMHAQVDIIGKGPMVFRLEFFHDATHPDSDRFNRDGFLMHGDNAEGDASLGCIVARPLVRRIVLDSPVRLLLVVRGNVIPSDSI